MNYLHQINGFWAKSIEDNLSSTEISTYFALLQYCNYLNWINPFVCHYDRVCQYAGLSKNTFYKSMDRLNELKYIEYSKGQKNSRQPKVFILKYKNRNGIEVRTEMEQNEEQKGNLYKLLNNKTIKLIEANHLLIESKLESWINETPKNDLPKNLPPNNLIYLHGDRQLLIQKLSHLNFNQQKEVGKLMNEYFGLWVEKGNPKSESQQNKQFELIPDKLPFDLIKKTINEAITGSHTAIYFKEQKSTEPIKQVFPLPKTIHR